MPGKQKRKVADPSLDMMFRNEHDREWRSKDVIHRIDAGFIHFRKIHTIIGTQGIALVNEQIERLPAGLLEHQRKLQIDHIYCDFMVMWCHHVGIKTLGEILATREGKMFCSTVNIGPCEFSDDRRRARNKILMPGSSENIEIHYSTEHIYGDTPRERLRDGGYPISMVAEFAQVNDDNIIVFDPILMGSPWLTDPVDQNRGVEWYATEYNQHFVEDFDEFSKVLKAPEVPSCEPLRNVTESAIKTCFAELLGDSVAKDWGGESSDYYSAHLHLAGRRKTAAFLFKGPARFAPMTLNHLGKNNDQIVRLAKEPADVLFVQHCHDISPPVRETLRAFAVQPSRPRRYCLIDGRDTLRLLNAYGLLEKAVKASVKSER